MKGKKFKGRVTLSIFLLLGFISLIMVTPVFATELRVDINDKEFEIIPSDQNLMNMTNMIPGDSVTSRLTIKNNFVNELEMRMRVERIDEEPGEGEPDLFKQLQMVVILNGDELHNGSMSDFASGEGISLGIFQNGDVKELEVEVTLPGPETGNEFMNLSHRNRWIFTAGEESIIIEEDDPPLGPIKEDTIIIEDEEIPIGQANLPKTGGGLPAELFFLAGAAIVTAGIVLKKKSE